METSNSSQKPLVEYLMGQAFPQSEFSQDDWVKILENTLEDLRPRLKYLTAMMEPERLLNRTMHHAAVKTRKSFYTDLPEEFTKSGKCAIVADFSFDPSVRGSKYHPREPSFDYLLMLSLRGGLFVCFAEYKQTGSKHSIVYETKMLRITPVELVALDMTRIVGKVIVDDLCVGAVVLDGLYRILKETIDCKMTYIKEMTEIAFDIRCKMERLDVFSLRFFEEDRVS